MLHALSDSVGAQLFLVMMVAVVQDLVLLGLPKLSLVLLGLVELMAVVSS